MKPKTDICLLLEGTYPYVTGGVSSWVHQLISSLQEFTFSLVIILPNKEFQQELKYPVPHNVQEIKRVYLHDYLLPKGTSGKLEKGSWANLEEFHRNPASKEEHYSFEALYRNFFNPDSRGIAPAKILDTKESWEILKKLYREKAQDESFLDYFWTFRFMHAPLFKILSTDLPEARVYHTVSTG